MDGPWDDKTMAVVARWLIVEVQLYQTSHLVQTMG